MFACFCVFDPCFVMHYLVSFLVLNRFAEEERAWSLYFKYVLAIVCLIVLAVPWVGLWSVIVAFPSHIVYTHLLFNRS